MSSINTDKLIISQILILVFFQKLAIKNAVLAKVTPGGQSNPSLYRVKTDMLRSTGKQSGESDGRDVGSEE